jgi:hypothetical protein
MASTVFFVAILRSSETARHSEEHIASIFMVEE